MTLCRADGGPRASGFDMALPAAAGSGIVRCGVVQSDDTLLGYLYRKVWLHIDPMDGGLGVLTDSHIADRVPFDR